MALIVLLYVASIACCNWFLHGEKEGNIFSWILMSKLYPVTLSKDLKNEKALNVTS